jgi:predicted PurR-regulated permease PerM
VTTRSGNDLTRVTFAVLVMALLIGTSLWVLRPFLGPTIWAVMVVVATWPVMLRVQRHLGGRRWLAVSVMTLLLLLLFVVPLTLAIVTIVQQRRPIVDWAKLASPATTCPRCAPAWVATLPMVGQQARRAGAGRGGWAWTACCPALTPYAGNVTRWFVAEVGSVGLLLLQFLMTVVIAAVLYGGGEGGRRPGAPLCAPAGGERGASTVQLAGDAIRGVALGVGVTALVQSVLGGLGWPSSTCRSPGC